ncbi:MAG: hypothetical protein JXA54_00535 [Candidatus Heimdallarchaeota archaeon]|nr:hypothetical protein [Candidatus Heimdallarchaeota archaeon]
MSEKKDEKIIEEAEEPETTLTSEDESEELEQQIEDEIEEHEETLEAKIDFEEEIEEEFSTESIEETSEVEFKVPEIPSMGENDEDLEISEIPTDKEELSEEDELAIPAVPEDEKVQLEDSDEYVVEEISAEEADIVDVEIKALKEKKVKVKKKIKKKRGPAFAFGTLIGLFLALLVIALFSIPLWLGGQGRPDLFYIELVLMFIVMMIPGLATRSVQKGILGAFIIFSISFAVPLILALFGLSVLLNPLTPIFSSTDFSIDAFNVFRGLFTALDELPIEEIQKWIWIVDLVIMFILTIVTVAIGTWLVKNITKPKKKVKNWIAIPILSIGMIIFVVFTPILFSSTYGIIQASTSFLAGTTNMQQAYYVFETYGVNPNLQQQTWISDNLTNANYWLNISYSNFQGLKNIGFMNFVGIVSERYGILIDAGDQLALATLTLTGVLYPLFGGIYNLTQSLNGATEDMANFGQPSTSPSLMLNDQNTLLTTKSDQDIEELKANIISSIAGMEAAEETLRKVLDQLTEADLTGDFSSIKALLNDLETDLFPEQVGNVIVEITSHLDDISNQLAGFENFITFTTNNIQPTKYILWTTYNSLVGNEYLRDYRFTEAKEAFNQAINNITLIDLTAPTAGGVAGVFAVDISDDYYTLLSDLVAMMNPLLHEEIEFATTYEKINSIMANFAADTISGVDYLENTAPLINGSNAETFGTSAQAELNSFRSNLALNAYGNIFTDIGKSINRTLTKDFKPYEFGVITNYMAQIMDAFVTSCQEYSSLTPNFAEASNNIQIANSIMNNDLLPMLTATDPVYLQNYMNNWSIALAKIQLAMDTYNTIGVQPEGLLAIQLEIITLYPNIEEK